MKCQTCDKNATVHVSELDGAIPVEYHVCEEHACDLSKLTGVEPIAIHSREMYTPGRT